jgi:hypothetical protein
MREGWISVFFKLFVPCILSTYEMKNQQMSLFQFYSYINRPLHVSGLQAHPQKNSHSCSYNHWFSGCTVRATCSVQSMRPEWYSHWTNGCMNTCVNSPEDGPVGPKHVEIHQYMNKIEIVTSVGFSFHMMNKCYMKLFIRLLRATILISLITQRRDRAQKICHLKFRAHFIIKISHSYVFHGQRIQSKLN